MNARTTTLMALCAVTSSLRADDLFASEIEPLFRQRCYECHSHSSGKMKGGLTLDSRSGWEEGGNTGPALVPGKVSASLMVKALRYADKDLQMPPKKKLDEAEIALVEQWIAQGAPDPRIAGASQAPASEWWALKPLKTRGGRPGAVGNPIDALIAVAPGPEVAPRILIRRLMYDLHGLPPTPEEVEAFEQACREHPESGVQELVDHLLASPRYGERFARLWLDVAHYGESNGFGMDRPRMNAWPYRDYVISAFNEDKPWPRFVQEQIAADALFPEEPRLLPALGFMAAGPFNQSALAEQTDGTDCKKIALNLDRDDMVSTVAASFLSVTLHCARCHEHKFDPISQRDYYRMQAVFAGVARGDRDFDPDPEVHRERQKWLNVRKRLEAGEPLARLDPADQERIKAQLAGFKSRVLATEQAWTPVQAEVATTSAKTTITSLPDGSIRFGGEALDKDTYTLTIHPALPEIAAVRVEVMTDDSLPHHGPGRQPANGNLHLSEATITTGTPPAAVKIKQARADFDQAGWEAKKTVDGNPATAWGIHPQEGRSHAIVFRLDKPLKAPQFVLKLDQLHGQQHLIGRLRVSTSANAKAQPGEPELLALFRQSASAKELGSGAGAKLVDAILDTLPPVQTVFAIGSQIPGHRKYTPPKTPYPIHILRRGDIHHEAQEVRPGALECVSALTAEFILPAASDEGARRAALAKWITDPDNPLTWRSMANRVWQWHFGRGLVETPNDFGKMGAQPSNPALLDWLARELRDTGSLKHLHRLIVTSRAYRQHREASLRLDAEQLRDSLLFVSGQLDTSMGGPSVMQFNFSDPNKEVSPRIDYEGFDPGSPASLRRGVYRFLFRNVSDPLLDAFDVADPSLSVAKRNATITPLQALALYNNSFVLSQSERLAARLQREAGSVESQIERAFLLLYSRRPLDDETRALAAYAQKRGLANACRVLINSNEFLFVQ